MLAYFRFIYYKKSTKIILKVNENDMIAKLFICQICTINQIGIYQVLWDFS